MGVLAGVEDATGFDLRRCEYFVGTSAGSIVAAHLVAGERPRRPPTTGTEIEPARPQPVTTLGRRGQAAAPAGRRAGRSPRARRSRRSRSGSPRPAGRCCARRCCAGCPVRTTTLDDLAAQHRATPARGSTGGCASPPSTGATAAASCSAARARRGRRVAEAVAASCSVPWLFAPVEIGGREYVDGGVWSATQPRRRARRPRHPRAVPEPDRQPRRAPTSVLAVVRSVARTAVSVEALALRRRGADVRTVAPNVECADGDGHELHGPRAARPRARGRLPRRALAARTDGRYEALRRARRPPPTPPRSPPRPRRPRLRRRSAFDSART